jgi:hypothetical protein
MANEIREKEPLTDAEILHDIKTKPTVPVWPHYAWAHNCCRHKAYQMAGKGGPEFLLVGAGEKRKMIRVLTAPLRKKLSIESAEGSHV